MGESGGLVGQSRILEPPSLTAMEQLLQVDEASESVEELKKPRSLKRVTSSPSAKKRSRIAK